MLHWWVKGRTTRKLFPWTHPLTPSTRLDRPQVSFFKSSLLPDWKSNANYQICEFFTIKLKARIYPAYILWVLLHRSETWCTYSRQEHCINAIHFKCLRFMLGVSWRAMSSTPPPCMSPAHMSSSPPWATTSDLDGSILRMDDGHLPTAILQGEFSNALHRVATPNLRYSTGHFFDPTLQLFATPHLASRMS